MNYVFCKNCDYYKPEICLDTCGMPALCLLDPIEKYHPVDGIYYTYIKCETRNENCNCLNFKPKRSFWKRLFKIK